MPLWEHLEELRKRIIISIVYVVVFTGVVYPFTPRILLFLKEQVGKLYFFSPQEALFVRVKLSYMLGILVSLPFIMHQVWLFVVPALTDEERKYSRAFLISGFFLFFAGVYTGYSIFLPFIVKTLLSFGGTELVPVIGVSNYLSFLIWVVAGMGLSFLLPLGTFLLARIGIIKPKAYLKQWRFGIVGILLFSAIITPTIDIITMLVVSIPLFILYLVSILTAFMGGR